MTQKKSFLFLVSSLIIALFISVGCDSSDSNPTSGEASIVGTWDLTSMTSTMEGQDITIQANQIDTYILLIPELGMLPETIIFNDNGTYQVTYVDGELETGTYVATDNTLTITPDGETVPMILNYTLDGNTATIEMETDDGQGGTISATLLYTKR